MAPAERSDQVKADGDTHSMKKRDLVMIFFGCFNMFQHVLSSDVDDKHLAYLKASFFLISDISFRRCEPPAPGSWAVAACHRWAPHRTAGWDRGKDGEDFGHAVLCIFLHGISTSANQDELTFVMFWWLFVTGSPLAQADWVQAIELNVNIGYHHDIMQCRHECLTMKYRLL